MPNSPKTKNKRFLGYDVVVRDLGALADPEIRQVFQRINSTGYSLNAMEHNNSRFDGEFKSTAEEIAEDEFFKDHRVFSANEVRRMEDTKFVLGYLTTVMSTYFHREVEIERFLEMYNEDFPLADALASETREVFEFIEKCDFEPRSRVWKHADIFTLLVEAHRVLVKQDLQLSSTAVSESLNGFYLKVDNQSEPNPQSDVALYRRATLQATNDRSNRIKRGDIVQKLLRT